MTSIHEEYRNQYAWRSWANIFSVLPSLEHQRVLDLGCAAGDQAAELARRGGHVVGVDQDPELLAIACGRTIPNAEFRRADLRHAMFDETFDGIWCSFTAAYFVDFAQVLAGWVRSLRPGGWIALIEVDDLFGHRPLAPTTQQLLEGYADNAWFQSRYDFRMGRKLAGYLTSSGLLIEQQFEVSDRELAFHGPADSGVVQAWERRFDRMTLLRAHCGVLYDGVRDDVIRCLQRPDHQSLATVICCIARKPLSAT